MRFWICVWLLWLAAPAWAQVPLPNERGTVEALAREMPTALTHSCQSAGGSWAFMDALVGRLQSKDSRWGYNAKRGNVTDPSHDAIAYHFGADAREGSPNVYIVDVIGGHCGDRPTAAWIDQTQATKDAGTIGRYLGHRPGRTTPPQIPPTPPAPPAPEPEPGPTHQQLMTRIGAIEGEIKAMRADVQMTALRLERAVERAEVAAHHAQQAAADLLVVKDWLVRGLQVRLSARFLGAMDGTVRAPDQE